MNIITCFLRRFMPALLLLCLAACMANAQFPHTISYQGLLADPYGNLLPDGNQLITLKIYSSATDPVPLFSETQQVTVVRGLFNLIIGSVAPLPTSMTFDRAYFIGISTGGSPELSPRTAMTAVPYALAAQNAVHARMADTAWWVAPGANVVTAVNGQSGAVNTVSSLNSQHGPLTIRGSGGASVYTLDGVITVHSTDTMLQTLRNFDGSVAVENPEGPYVKIAVADGGVRTAKLADGSVTTAKLAPGTLPLALPPAGLAGGDLAGEYPNPVLASNTVTTAKLADLSVSSAKLASQSVTGPKIADRAVTASKINEGAVTAAKLAPGVIPTVFPPSGPAWGDLTGSYPAPALALNAVTTNKIADSAVGTAKLADGCVTNAKVAGGIEYAKIIHAPATLPPAGPAGGVLAGSYPSPGFAPGAVTTTAIADGTIQAVDIAPGVIPNNLVLGGPAGGDLSGTYPNPVILSQAVTQGKIASNAVTNGKLATDAVTSNKILDGTIQGADIASGTVTSANLSTTGVVPGTYGNATQAAALTLDAAGRVTAVSPVTIAGVQPGGSAGGDLAGVYPNPTVGQVSLGGTIYYQFLKNPSNVPRIHAVNASGNLAFGADALSGTTTGSGNTALGHQALQTNTTGSGNTAVGNGADLSAGNYSNATAIGHGAVATGSNTVRIGDASVISIGGYQGWSNVSDMRIKDDIRQDVPGLEFILRLRPVTYRLNLDKIRKITGINDTTQNPVARDMEKMRLSGFLAQQVAVAAHEAGYQFSGVEVPANPGQLYALRYGDFVMPLVQAVQQQQQTLVQLQARNEELLRRLEELEKKALMTGQ